MKKISTFILIMCLLFICFGCDRTEDEQNNKYSVYIFDDFCKYNLDLVEDVTIKDIAIPLISNYALNTEGAFSFSKVNGDNLNGIDIVFTKKQNVGVFRSLDISVMLFNIETNDDYSFNEQEKIINEFVFELSEKEYKIPVDIVLKPKTNYEGIYNSILEINSLNINNTVEIVSWDTNLNENYIIKNIFSYHDNLDITLQKCKQYVTEVNQGIQVSYKYSVDFDNIEKAYINDYDFYELGVVASAKVPDAFCCGDMLYFEVENEVSKEKYNIAWGSMTYVDIHVIINLLKEYLDS